MKQHLLLPPLLVVVSDEATKGGTSRTSHLQSGMSDCLPGITAQLQQHVQGVWDQPVALQSGPLDMHSERGDALLHEGTLQLPLQAP